MYAVSVNSFLAPNGIINGGFTGIATILNRLFSLPIGTAVFIMNIPLFFLAYKKLGKGFIVKTVFATFTVSFIIDYTSAFCRYIQVTDFSRPFSARLPEAQGSRLSLPATQPRAELIRRQSL